MLFLYKSDDMRLYLTLTICCILLFSCESNVKESVIHRRNFSKNVFEEEFESVKVGCDTINMVVLIPNTKWLSISSKHISKDDPTLHNFELNKKLELKERTYDHALVLEKIDNGAFMFRYTGIQTVTDTLTAIELNKLDSPLDSTKIFSFEGTKYYKVKETLENSNDVKTIYKSMKTEDKGRVVCKCDYYTE